MQEFTTPHSSDSSLKLRSIKSYSCREHSLTPAQAHSWEEGWPQFGVVVEHDHLLNFDALFKRPASQQKAMRTLEIGFGEGSSLAEMAHHFPARDFIGIEVYRRGIATLLKKIAQFNLSNVRIIHGDAQQLLANNIPNHSVNTIQLFFADPWPKTRHHKRRLIQPEFVELLATKLIQGGTLHLATDWEDYATHMMKVISKNNHFKNAKGPGEFSDRPVERPMTKYERRALLEKRSIFDLIFVRE